MPRRNTSARPAATKTHKSTATITQAFKTFDNFHHLITLSLLPLLLLLPQSLQVSIRMFKPHLHLLRPVAEHIECDDCGEHGSAEFDLCLVGAFCVCGWLI